MRNELPKAPKQIECGIVNFNTTNERGSHWVCYYKNDTKRIYFDSFGQITPIEIQNYLKTKREKEAGVSIIQGNTDIVQKINTQICGHLCLFVPKALTSEHWSFQEVLNYLDGYP